MLSSEGKAAVQRTVGLAAAGGNCLHMFVIRGKRKKSGKEEEEEGGGGDVRGRGGQMWLQMRRGASWWRCETVQRAKQHLLQIDRQAGRQLSPFQTRGTSGKTEFLPLRSSFQSFSLSS